MTKKQMKMEMKIKMQKQLQRRRKKKQKMMKKKTMQKRKMKMMVVEEIVNRQVLAHVGMAFQQFSKTITEGLFYNTLKKRKECI